MGAYAAYLCDTLTLNGYHDWYLPSRNELNMLYINRYAIGNFITYGGLNALGYWSSTESDSFSAWDQFFSDGAQYGVMKNKAGYVRAIRSF
jgi:hypothetical protein